MFARKQTSVTALAVIGKDNPLVMLFAAHAVGVHQTGKPIVLVHERSLPRLPPLHLRIQQKPAASWRATVEASNACTSLPSSTGHSSRARTASSERRHD